MGTHALQFANDFIVTGGQFEFVHCPWEWQQGFRIYRGWRRWWGCRHAAGQQRCHQKRDNKLRHRSMSLDMGAHQVDAYFEIQLGENSNKFLPKSSTTESRRNVSGVAQFCASPG
jgi:hypothetical protein